MKITGAIIVIFISNIVFAQKDTNNLDRSFGFSLNTSICGYSYNLPTVIALTYRNQNHQFELGPKFQFTRNDYYKRQLGIEFDYRYYPNGIEKRFSMFLLINADYYSRLLLREYQQYSNDPLFAGTVNQRSTRNYYTLNAGYGVQMNLLGKLYLGSNIGIGILLEDYDDKRTSTNENLNSYKGDFSEELNFIASMSLGYRF
jgi:opacity protein-like surface antigen